MERPPFWLAVDNRRTARRRARIRRTHGHVAMPYPVEGCALCQPRVVRRGVR